MRKILVRLLLVLLLMCVLGTIILSLPAVQTRFAQYATSSINKEFGTNINIEKLRVSLLSWETTLNGIYIEDFRKDTLFYVNDLSTSVLSVKNMMNGKMEFGDIDIDKLDFKLKTYKDSVGTNLEVFIDKLDDGQPRKPGTPPFFFSSSNVQVANSRFRLIDENKEKEKVLDFKKLNISGNDFQILGPEVDVGIETMNFSSGRGIDVRNLSTLFKYTKQQMRFDSLAINTTESKLLGNLQFDYERSDFLDFFNKVNVTAQFTESTVSFDEINLLYNRFGKGKQASFSSNINGVLNDLNTDDLFVVSNNTGIRGDFNFVNLFTKSEPFSMQGKMKNVSTSYYELRSLLPNILGQSWPTSFKKMGQFTIRGDVFVTETSISTKVNLNTAIGSSYADLYLTDIDNIDNATYKGFISLIDFDLGGFVENKSLGKASLDFNVEGKGFVQKNLNTEIIGQVYSLVFNGYEYNDLKVSGILKEQLFDGTLNSNDENVKFDFKGLADLGNDLNNFNFIASVDYMDLKKLNFINDSVSIFRGNVNMDISGSTLDDFVGDIKFTQTNFQNKNDTYYFDDFKVSSAFENDSTRIIDINSPDIITGYMKGKFKVDELGKLVQNSLGTVYTNYRPFEISPGQTLAFNFKIYNKIVDVFFPEVKFDPNTFIKGNIVADNGDFKLNFRSPSIAAFGNQADNIEVTIDNKNPLFNTFVAVGDLSTNYYDVKDFNLINTTLKDTLFFRTEFKGGSEFNDSYNLNFYHTFNKENKSVIGLKTSDVNFKGNEWVLNKDGNNQNKVIINRTLDSLSIQEIVMHNSEEEEIRLKGQLADSTYKDLELQFKIVSLNKITPEIDSLRLQGEVNGILNLWQKDGIYLPSSNLGIDDFSINDMRMGDLKMSIAGNRDLTEFIVNSEISDNDIEKLSVVGNIKNYDTPEVDLLASFTDLDLEPFAPLGEGVIGNIRGDLNGNARIKGAPNNPDFSGILTLNNAGIGIPFLNVDYDFAKNSRVNLDKQTFDFDNIALTDVATGSKATIDGTITHDHFDDWQLDFQVDTKNEPFLLLNTEFDEEVLYYGTAYLNGQGRIFGPTNALNISVDGETGPGTSLKIPLSDVASIGDYSFINFVEKTTVAEEEEAERVLDTYQGIEMEFDLDITDDAEIEIVTDTQTGSSLKGTGEGPMLMRINTNGTFQMYGNYVVVTGEFNYKLGGVINKTFKVEPGGDIYWDGDPLGAIVNMRAVYSLNANPAPLLDSQGARRIPTDVVILMSEELENMDIDFDIEFPGSNSILQSELEYQLQDPTIEEKQAIFLLAQGSFVNDQSGINTQAVTGNLIQSASGLLNQVLGGDNDKFNLGLSYEQGYSDPAAAFETEDRIGVTVSTKISDRVLLNGRVGVPVGGTTETVVAGDFELQLLLNEEGTLSAKFFNKESEIQQFLGERQGYTQGAGLSYQVDFDSFKELFRKIFRRVEKDQKIIPEQIGQPTSVMGQDSLIRFYPKTSGNLIPEEE